MLADAAAGDRTRFERVFDVCIAGAGPAGITLARTLAARGLDVALMEAGGLDFNEERQSFYEGEVAGTTSYPPDETRLRMLGGSSGHWEGKCRTLETLDFEVRSWMPHSGWPICRADLEPHEAAAAAILDLEARTESPDIAITQSQDRFRRFDWRWSPPTHFGEKYRDELTASPRITLCLSANLVDLRLSDDLRTITGAVFRSYDPTDAGFTVRARAYALCLGGLENARMLLNARSQVPVGIGNDRDLVGRYYCNRPTVIVADLMLVAPIGPDAAYFRPTPGYQEAERVGGFALAIEPRGVREPIPFAAALSKTAVCMTPEIMRLVERIRAKRSVCMVGGLDEFGVRYAPARHPTALVSLALEQTLNPESRVTLCGATDAFGLRRLRVDWRLTDADFRTFRIGALAFGAHLAEQDIGRIKLREWLRDAPIALPAIESGNGVIDGRQHMCTTRMSEDASTGVVDADCRVHGLANLHIGGSSVFASPGFAKPTMTIVQLALRLGDHLGQTLTR